ncbi:hypothetical protein LINGRAHAP2_LOCUS33338, partial [Linum grandiflorum]
IVGGKAAAISVNSPIAAEAEALLAAIGIGNQLAIPCRIRYDCKTLVDILNGAQDPWPWDCAARIADMISTLRMSNLLRVSFIPRLSNARADNVAKMAARGTLPQEWLANFTGVHP